MNKYKLTREEFVSKHFGDKTKIENSWDKALIEDLLAEVDTDYLPYKIPGFKEAIDSLNTLSLYVRDSDKERKI